MSLRSDVVKLAHKHPELRAELLPLLKKGMEHATEDARKKYLQEHPKAEPKNHTVGGGGGGGGKKDEGAKSAPKEVALSKAQYGQLSKALEGWNQPGSWEHVVSYAISGKPMDPKNVQEVVGEIDQYLASWDIYSKSNGWGAADKKNLTKAKKLLEKGLGTPKKEEKPEPKKEDEGKEDKPKTKVKIKVKPAAKKVMDKYSLTDDDADEVAAFKRKKGPGTKVSDAVLMQRFLAEASPETKKRIMGPPKMSAVDFKVMLAAISDDEDDGEGGDIKFGTLRELRAHFRLAERRARRIAKHPPKSMDLNRVPNSDGFWDLSVQDAAHGAGVRVPGASSDIGDVIMFLNMVGGQWESNGGSMPGMRAATLADKKHAIRLVLLRSKRAAKK